MLANNIILIILSLGVVSFIIGLPTFLLGCNPSVSKNCVAYSIFNGHVYKTGVYEKTCSRCSSKDKNEKCKSYQYYSCWDAYVYAQNLNNYNQTTSSCKLQTASSQSYEYSAEKSTDKYSIGEKVNWYKRKGSSECETGGTVITLWFVGIVFLSFTGFMVLIILVDLAINFVEQTSSYNKINTNTNIDINNQTKTIELSGMNDFNV